MSKRSVIVVSPTHWERVLVRAELIERGHDVVGMHGLGELLMFHAAAEGHARIGVVLVDGAAITGLARRVLGVLRTRLRDARFVLLAEHVGKVPDGPWDDILMRPISIGEIATRIDNLLAVAAPPGAPSIEVS